MDVIAISSLVVDHVTVQSSKISKTYVSICLAKIHIQVMNFALIANFIVLCNYQLFVEYQKNWLRRYTGNCCSSLEYLKIFVIINIFNVHGVTQKCESKAQVYADSFKMLNYFSMFLLNVNVFMVSKADDDS